MSTKFNLFFFFYIIWKFIRLTVIFMAPQLKLKDAILIPPSTAINLFTFVYITFYPIFSFIIIHAHRRNIHV